jgi:hypothetical protein
MVYIYIYLGFINVVASHVIPPGGPHVGDPWYKLIYWTSLRIYTFNAKMRFWTGLNWLRIETGDGLLL